MQSLGQWKKREAAPASVGSNSYATALGGLFDGAGRVSTSEAQLGKALSWLRAHQNPQGFRAADSMNHKHEASTVPEKFMSDAATGYATAALLAAGKDGVQHSTSNSQSR